MLGNQIKLRIWHSHINLTLRLGLNGWLDNISQWFLFIILLFFHWFFHWFFLSLNSRFIFHWRCTSNALLLLQVFGFLKDSSSFNLLGTSFILILSLIDEILCLLFARIFYLNRRYIYWFLITIVIEGLISK